MQRKSDYSTYVLAFEIGKNGRYICSIDVNIKIKLFESYHSKYTLGDLAYIKWGKAAEGYLQLAVDENGIWANSEVVKNDTEYTNGRRVPVGVGLWRFDGSALFRQYTRDVTWIDYQK